MADQKPAVLPPPPPQWVLDLNATPVSKPKASNLPEPPGFPQPTAQAKRGNASKQSTSAARKQASPDEMDTLKMKKAWELAIAPAKSLPMNAFGMWMTGNSLQIFSIFMVFTLFKTPIQSLMNTGNTFARFESETLKSRLLLVKVVYVLTNLLAFGLGIYKINKMGLLPTTRSDWLAWESPRIPLEIAYHDER